MRWTPLRIGASVVLGAAALVLALALRTGDPMLLVVGVLGVAAGGALAWNARKGSA